MKKDSIIKICKEINNYSLTTNYSCQYKWKGVKSGIFICECVRRTYLVPNRIRVVLDDLRLLLRP